MTIKNPEDYDIVGYRGERVGTLRKATRKYFVDTTGTKWSRESTAGIPPLYSIVKKKTTPKPQIPVKISTKKKRIPKELQGIAKLARRYKTVKAYEESFMDVFSTRPYRKPIVEEALINADFVIRKKGSRHVTFDAKAFWKAAQQSAKKTNDQPKKRKKPAQPKIPTGMTLQKSLSKTGGQMHFKNGGGKKKPKVLSAKKTKKRVKRIKKGSDNLMTFGIKMPDVRTLEDMMR